MCLGEDADISYPLLCAVEVLGVLGGCGERGFIWMPWVVSKFEWYGLSSSSAFEFMDDMP